MKLLAGLLKTTHYRVSCSRRTLAAPARCTEVSATRGQRDRAPDFPAVSCGSFIVLLTARNRQLRASTDTPPISTREAVSSWAERRAKDIRSVEMKQDEKSGNSGGGQDGVVSGAAPNESTSSGDTNDAASAASGSGDGVPAPGSGAEHPAAEPARKDSTADSTSHELNTSGCSREEESSSCSETAEGTAKIGRSSENEIEHSISSCNDSVSESNPRDNLSSCSGSSIQSGAIDKSGSYCDNNEIDNISTEAVVPSLDDDPQAETVDETLSESSPIVDFLRSSSVTSTPSVVGSNSGTSDMDYSPPSPPSETGAVISESLTYQDAILQDEGSALKNKMTLRSGKVTQAESVVPKKQRDTNKIKKKSSARATKRRCSVDQGSSSSEENPEKLLRLEPTETSTSCTKDDDAPLHEASDTTPAEQEVAVTGNGKPEDEKLDANISEVTPDNDLKSVIKEEVLDQTSTNSESSAYHSADNVTDSLSRKDIGGDEDFSSCVKLEVPDMPEVNAPSGSTSGVSTEDVKETQTGGPERRTSRDSESCSDENEFAVNCAGEIMDCEYEDDSRDDYYEECSVEAVDNALKANSVHDFTVNMRSDLREMSPEVRTTPWQSATVHNSEHSLTRRLIPTSEFDTNAPSDAEVHLRGERMQPVSKASQHSEAQVSTAVPDSSTEEAVGEIAPNTDTNMQQQMPSNISQSLDADAATDEQMNCASPRHDGLSGCTKQVDDDIPHKNRSTAASVTQGTECKTAEDAPQDTGDLESPGEAQFEERNLQIYRYIAASGASDVRYSPYVTRRRPLRSGNAGEENYRRIFIRGHRREARQGDDNGLQTSSGGQFGEHCCVS